MCFLQVREQRVSNMLQSLLVAACLGITPAIQQIPTGALWGYFIFMAVESLAGSQLWERLLLLATDPKKRLVIMQQDHAAYMQVRRTFRVLKIVYVQGLLAVWRGVVCIQAIDHAAGPCSINAGETEDRACASTAGSSDVCGVHFEIRSYGRTMHQICRWVHVCASAGAAGVHSDAWFLGAAQAHMLGMWHSRADQHVWCAVNAVLV